MNIYSSYLLTSFLNCLHCVLVLCNTCSLYCDEFSQIFILLFLLKKINMKILLWLHGYMVWVWFFFYYYFFSPPIKVNQPKFNQRRISSAKFLGELYNYRMVESAVIFRTLYSFTSFGVNPDGSPSPLDPPEHLFRIRLVCTILDTCGQYFDRGSSKRKLDCFLVYFQVL